MTTAATEPTIHTRALDIAAAFHCNEYKLERWMVDMNPGRIAYRVLDDNGDTIATILILART